MKLTILLLTIIALSATATGCLGGYGGAGFVRGFQGGLYGMPYRSLDMTCMNYGGGYTHCHGY